MINVVRKLTLLLLFFVSVQSTVSLAQEIRVSVDHSEVVLGQAITLTIEAPRKGQSVNPDLAPLTKDFEVLEILSANAFSPSSSTWVIEIYVVTIMPRKVGVLTIPSLTIYDGQTEPMDIIVISATSQQLVLSGAGFSPDLMTAIGRKRL